MGASGGDPCGAQAGACFIDFECEQMMATGNMDACQSNELCNALMQCDQQNSNPCPDQEAACVNEPACLQILQNGPDNAPPECNGNANCDALMQCMMGSGGSPCPDQ